MSNSREQWYPCGPMPQIISWEWLQCATCAYCFSSKLWPRTVTAFRFVFLDSNHLLAFVREKVQSVNLRFRIEVKVDLLYRAAQNYGMKGCSKCSDILSREKAGHRNICSNMSCHICIKEEEKNKRKDCHLNKSTTLEEEDDFSLATKVGQRSRTEALVVLRAPKLLEMTVAREEAMALARSVAFSRSSLQSKDNFEYIY